MTSKTDASETVAAILRRHSLDVIKGEAKAEDPAKDKMKFSGHSFGAQFAEVRVHSLTGAVRVARMLGAFATGIRLRDLPITPDRVLMAMANTSA